jgi:hypothetical protein
MPPQVPKIPAVDRLSRDTTDLLVIAREREGVVRWALQCSIAVADVASAGVYIQPGWNAGSVDFPAVRGEGAAGPMAFRSRGEATPMLLQLA